MAPPTVKPPSIQSVTTVIVDKDTIAVAHASPSCAYKGQDAFKMCRLTVYVADYPSNKLQALQRIINGNEEPVEKVPALNFVDQPFKLLTPEENELKTRWTANQKIIESGAFAFLSLWLDFKKSLSSECGVGECFSTEDKSYVDSFGARIFVDAECDNGVLKEMFLIDLLNKVEVSITNPSVLSQVPFSEICPVPKGQSVALPVEDTPQAGKTL